ncbi:MAG: CcmD family protein [Bacteroidota bacterium]|jgi:hypothetical protein
MKRKLSALFFVLATSRPSFGQGVEMADVMRSNGKIYVVVAVAATVMAGIIGYMAYMDARIRKMEKKQQNSGPKP